MVSVVSHFVSAPTVKHSTALEIIQCYMNESPGLGILYKNHNNTCIEYFADVDGWFQN